MPKKRYVVLALGLLASVCLGATPLTPLPQVRVSIREVALSPQILLQIYNHRRAGSLGWSDPNIFRMLVNATGNYAHLRFDVEIYDRGMLVAAARNFQVLGKLLQKGENRYDANDISATNLSMFFEEKYQPNSDLANLATGTLMRMASYQVVIRPMDPQGDPLTLALTLSAPQSAFTSPPVPIYPRDVEVDTMLPNFMWTAVAKAIGYEVSVGPEPNPETNSYWRSGRVQGTQVMYASSARALENGAKYYWQVRAFDTFGTPVGGVDGRSQPAVFIMNSRAKVVTSIPPSQVEGVLKNAIIDPAVLASLAGYQPVGIETDCGDLAGLLRQLQEGSAKVTSARVE